MDILIKRKNYDRALEFLNDKTDEKEWSVFLENIKKDEEFLFYFKNFISNCKCIFTLKLILSKLFQTHKDRDKDEKYQSLLLSVIIGLIENESEFSNHFLIKNILCAQIIKMCIFKTQEGREHLKNLIIKKKINDQWFIEILIMFKYNEELGLYYEINEDYQASLKYYIESKNDIKANELRQKLQQQVIDSENNQNESISIAEFVNEENLFICK